MASSMGVTTSRVLAVEESQRQGHGDQAGIEGTSIRINCRAW
jgi:hypothetical protein